MTRAEGRCSIIILICTTVRKREATQISLLNCPWRTVTSTEAVLYTSGTDQHPNLCDIDYPMTDRDSSWA